MIPPATPIAQTAVSGAGQGSDAVLLLCCIPPLLLIALGVAIYLWQREHRQLVDARRLLDGLSEQINQLSRQAREALRQQWILSLPGVEYGNEIEVEVLFIAPLVTYLGFDARQVDLRVSVGVQVGRQTTMGQADWVLYDQQHSRPLVVIEAKAPGQALNGAVQNQARSYAFALGAPTFMLTNGSRLQIYQRGVQADQLVVDCTVEELVEQWPTVVDAFNPKG